MEMRGDAGIKCEGDHGGEQDEELGRVRRGGSLALARGKIVAYW